MNEKGTLSVHTENIFPIIKKFLYSDQDIFLRELVANGIDAVQKLKKLSSMGLYDGPMDGLSVAVAIDPEQKTLTIKDNGIGMTAEEIKQYINQIAFSGATAFVEKYKEQVDQNPLIGFFGLGFYSAFMVAKKVEIRTKSHQSDAPAVRWSCTGTTDFEIDVVDKPEVGTEVVLHLAEDAQEYLEKERIRSILKTHCRFLPVPILFDGETINPIAPLWTQNPSDTTAESYVAFYKELYPLAPDPLFWIHLNIDYPFTLTGILYFPKMPNYFEHKETIQLYIRQMFVTNDVSAVVPDFLRLLHGVIDSPDIPLNVSRSALQSDKNVKKINAYIAKKVAEKLASLFHEDRTAYEASWKDISLFVKYGAITDEKFAEKVGDVILVQNIQGQYHTLAAYQERVAANQIDKEGNVVFLYATDPQKQAVYVKAAERKGYDVLLLDGPLDANFIHFQESKATKTKWKGVDSQTSNNLIPKASSSVLALTEAEQTELKTIYEEAIRSENVFCRVVAMEPEDLPLLCTTSEMQKRMERFAQRNGGDKEACRFLDLSINGNHPFAKKILATQDKEVRQAWVTHAYRLALLAQGLLEGTALTEFVERDFGGLMDA